MTVTEILADNLRRLMQGPAQDTYDAAVDAAMEARK